MNNIYNYLLMDVTTKNAPTIVGSYSNKEEAKKIINKYRKTPFILYFIPTDKTLAVFDNQSNRFNPGFIAHEYFHEIPELSLQTAEDISSLLKVDKIVLTAVKEGISQISRFIGTLDVVPKKVFLTNCNHKKDNLKTKNVFLVIFYSEQTEKITYLKLKEFKIQEYITVNPVLLPLTKFEEFFYSGKINGTTIDREYLDSSLAIPLDVIGGRGNYE